MDKGKSITKYTDILQAKSRLHRLHQMPVTTYVVLEEKNFLKTLQNKTSELEKLYDKGPPKEKSDGHC